MESKKTHKAMSDSEWMSRLRTFASTGSWPSSAGNRPAPRQKKWHDLYNKIEKCPLQMRSQRTLLNEPQKCVCGFHIPKTTPSPHQTESAAAASSSRDVASPSKKVKMTLSMFERSRYSGHHVLAARPNINVARRSRTPQEQKQSCSEAGNFHTSTPPLEPETVCPPLTDLSGDSAGDSAALPLLWPGTVPLEDQKWMSAALFHIGARGKLELRDSLQLWYHPPQPALVYNQAPTPSRFFGHSLLLWMPYRLWRVRVLCTNSACVQYPLSSGGIHKRVRQVLDVDRYYNLATETLICYKCRSSYLSWGPQILSQLDLPHRSEFRVILTRKYACDIRVIRLLRERGLGNSPTRIIGQLRENHSEEWLKRVARYTSECAAFMNTPGLLPIKFQEPPKHPTLPNYKWLLVVYSRDILNRVEDIKANITSTFGTILKLDSTRKITKKLSGSAKGTAQWLTSVGNEMGQILVSVLTASEGPALDPLAAGLVNRYQSAGVEPPVALYVDCGCCKEAGPTKLKARFSGWPNLIIRLDIWHFMRRLASGVTTDAHQLYPTFMARMSACIFEWDAADVAELRRAKRQQLQEQSLTVLTEREVDCHITKDELALHCRRRTRGWRRPPSP
ncbi:hypothetical protein OJAV_G00039730 [Oryzias javanicus]|uniref:DUF6729 domain-containing protein n=1 Tax=Oryzias javanicus TaxID=123683 RepID=A0A3S2N2S1_ORYJA|nr:hypothetical protein OJAV_G00039730 [Oryzias javanicus]